MASLFRNSRSIITRFSCARRTATTTVAAASSSGTQPKTTGGTTAFSQASRQPNETNMAVRDSRQRSAVADPIKPRAAGEPAYIPLVGRALNVWGQMGFGLVLALSAYFIYINYITNPEFYKSLKQSREASKRDSQQQTAKREGHGGH